MPESKTVQSVRALRNSAKTIRAAIEICRDLQCVDAVDKLRPVVGMLDGAAKIAESLEETTEL